MFNKLVDLVKEQNLLNEEEIIKLIPDATITAEEAIKDYRLLPPNYSLQSSGDITFIVNKSLNARLPVSCKSTVELHTILAKLLVGDVIENKENNSDFSINGQDYILLAPFEPLKLPNKPYIDKSLDYDNDNSYSLLQ